jgi:hypothetical protein
MATNRNYTEDFQHNVKVSLEAEEIAQQLLWQLTHKKFTSVRDNPEYFHIGDLLSSDGKGYDVKDDGIIHNSGNVFCEVKKKWKSGKVTDGWMLNGEYDYLVILDRVGKNIYVLDFKKLKKIYKPYGFYKNNINMGDNYTDGFIVSLLRCRMLGVIVHEAQYTYDEDWDCYDIVA